jgi:hypothetical protein
MHVWYQGKSHLVEGIAFMYDLSCRYDLGDHGLVPENEVMVMEETPRHWWDESK